MWLDRLDAGGDNWERNQLSIITFNYDRSFEHYFTELIMNRSDVPRPVAFKILGHLKIVHVHGILGPYPQSPTDDEIQYGAPLTARCVADAAQGIKVVQEVEDTLPAFDDAFSLLSKAHRIYFLGFGFNKDNIRRLRFFNDRAIDDPDGPSVAGTTCGYTDNEWAERLAYFNGHWNGRAFDSTCYEFMRHRFERD